jgi:hypothetical protein
MGYWKTTIYYTFNRVFRNNIENTCQQIKTNFFMHTQLEMKKLTFVGQIFNSFHVEPYIMGWQLNLKA